MHSRQSTMFKPLAIFVIFLAVSSLAYGQDSGQGSGEANNNSSSSESSSEVSSTDDSSTEDSSTEDSSTEVATSPEDNNNSGGLIARILTLPVTIISTLLKPITAPLGFLLSRINGLIGLILTPVYGILELVGTIFSGVRNLLSWIFALLSTIFSLLVSNGSGILSVILHILSTEAAVGRSKRSIMDSLTGMIWMTLPYPFRFVNNIYGFIISPLCFIYNVIMWPYYFIFDSGGNHLSAETAFSTSSYFTDLPSSIFEPIKYLLNNLSDSSQEAITELLIELWTMAKVQLLPIMDNYITIATTSDFVPEDVKKWLRQIHSMYTMLHMIGVL